MTNLKKKTTTYYSIYLACVSTWFSFLINFEIISRNTTEYWEATKSDTYSMAYFLKKYMVFNAASSIDGIELKWSQR